MLATYSHVMLLSSTFIMDKFVFKRRRTEQQKVVAGVLDKTMVTPTPAGEDLHSGPAFFMCQAEEEMEQEEEDEDEERGWHGHPQPTTAGMDTGHGANANTDVSQRPWDGPRRPMRKMYPSRLMGNQQRSFNAAWFDTYSWLEYSVEMDVVLFFFTDPARDLCFVLIQFLRRITNYLRNSSSDTRKTLDVQRVIDAFALQTTKTGRLYSLENLNLVSFNIVLGNFADFVIAFCVLRVACFMIFLAAQLVYLICGRCVLTLGCCVVDYIWL